MTLYEIDFFDREEEGIPYHIRTARINCDSEAMIPFKLRDAGYTPSKLRRVRVVPAGEGRR